MGVAGIGPRHARAGRKLANLTVSQLASRARLTQVEIVELEDNVLVPPHVNIAAQVALEAAGVRFLFAEYDNRLAVQFDHKSVSAGVVIGAGCGLLKWSWRKLCRRSGLFAGDLRRELGGTRPDARMVRRCLAVLSIEGCTALKNGNGQWSGIELRRDFWERSVSWPVFMDGKPRGWE